MLNVYFIHVVLHEAGNAFFSPCNAFFTHLQRIFLRIDAGCNAITHFFTLSVRNERKVMNLKKKEERLRILRKCVAMVNFIEKGTKFQWITIILHICPALRTSAALMRVSQTNQADRQNAGRLRVPHTATTTGITGSRGECLGYRSWQKNHCVGSAVAEGERQRPAWWITSYRSHRAAGSTLGKTYNRYAIAATPESQPKSGTKTTKANRSDLRH